MKNQKLPGFYEIKINSEDAKRTGTLNTSLLQGNLTLTMITQQTLNITDKHPSGHPREITERERDLLHPNNPDKANKFRLTLS